MLLRPPVPAEARLVLDLILARDIADLGHPDYSLEDVQADWTAPGVVLEKDAWVAEQDGELLGYALVDQEGAALVTVPPASEGRGVGTALREAAEARAVERGVTPCRQFVPASNELAAAHLTRAGYRVAYRYFRLHTDLADTPPPPEGIAVRPFERGSDDAAVHELLEAAFAEIPGNLAQSLESWRAGTMEKPSFDPSLWLLHEDAEGLAGVVLCARWEGGGGYVEHLAVATRARRRGLGRGLLLHGLGALKAAGLATAELSVQGENASAISLYESVGMRPKWTAERWEKPL